MEKNSNKKEIIKTKEIKLQATVAKLSEISQKREKELAELDRIAKMLIRRDFELTEIRGEGEKELAELERKTKELKDSRKALINMLEDVEGTRRLAIEERDKTLTIINNFTDGLLVFDKKNNISLMNPQAEDFFEINVEKIVGKSTTELTKIPIFEPLTNLFGEKIKKIFRKELLLKKNLVLEVTVIPLMRERKKIGTLVVLHDITREKLIERMKTEFVSLAAHQLRTPLSAIKWTLRMLLDGDLGEITEEQRDFLTKTYISNERMISLINDLLNVTRIEEGRYLYRPIFVQVEEIVQSAIDSFREEIRKKNIKFKFKKPEKKLPKILIDMEKIKLAIENLFNNAIRYTLPGGEVTVSLKHAKKEVEFLIKDTGIGIPKDQQKRVFTKFFRAANVMRMETEGTGLGLFVTKNIIEAHGGKILFESEEGKGTTFYFTIPARKNLNNFLKSSKIK